MISPLSQPSPTYCPPNVLDLNFVNFKIIPSPLPSFSLCSILATKAWSRGETENVFISFLAWKQMQETVVIPAVVGRRLDSDV